MFCWMALWNTELWKHKTKIIIFQCRQFLCIRTRGTDGRQFFFSLPELRVRSKTLSFMRTLWTSSKWCSCFCRFPFSFLFWQGKMQMWVDIFPEELGYPGAPINVSPRKPDEWVWQHQNLVGTAELDTATVSVFVSLSALRTVFDKRIYRHLGGFERVGSVLTTNCHVSGTAYITRTATISVSLAVFYSPLQPITFSLLLQLSHSYFHVRNLKFFCQILNPIVCTVALTRPESPKSF